MAENHIAHESALTEAATYEPASPFHSVPSEIEEQPDDDGAFPDFATEEEANAYYRGLSHGIRCAGREPGHPHMPRDFSLDLARDPAKPGLVSARLIEAWPEEKHPSPVVPSEVERRQRAPRHDGWTPARERLFLDALARTGVVADACRAAGIGRDSAYAYRKRAAGRAFALGWDAAILISRRAIADDVICRARHGVVDRIYKDGKLVAERHRYDNRLTMAVLARLDRLAEGQGEGAAVANAIAGEWDQYLDIVEAGGDGAEGFLRARSNCPRNGEVAARRADGGGPLHHRAAPGGPPPRSGEELESAASLLARLAAYGKYEAGLPHEIRTADLDPAAMAAWTEEQWARAEYSGFLDRLPADAWPAEAVSGEADGPDGMCLVRRLYRERHGVEPDVAAEEADDLAAIRVWEEGDELRTDFPPPAGFDGYEEGEPGEEDYRRELTDAELRAIGEDAESRAAEQAERLAEECAERDRFFGFQGGFDALGGYELYGPSGDAADPASPPDQDHANLAASSGRQCSD